MNKTKALFVLVPLVMPLANLRATPQDDQFQRIAHDYIEGFLTSNPEYATELGDHRFDDKLTDYSAGTRAQELARAQQSAAAAEAFNDLSQLTGANKVDVRLLKDNVDNEIFDIEELREWEWNPLVYNQSLANSIYLLVARDFAPAEQRIPNLRKRLEGIPAVIAQAKANLKHSPKIYTETAIEQTQGAISLVREGLSPLLNQRAAGDRRDLGPIQEKTAKALEDYKTWLQKDLLPRSDGDFRLGADKFRKKLRFALASDLSMEEIMQRAQADLAQTQKAIYETALPLYKKYFPNAGKATLEDKKKVTAAVLDKLGEQHPDDNTIVSYAQKLCGKRPTSPNSTTWLRCRRSRLRSSLCRSSSAGRGLPIAILRGRWSIMAKHFSRSNRPRKIGATQRKQSFFREYNNYMCRDLTVHEAMPGHYLQLAHANEFRAPTLVRAIFRSGTFIEGWAVYCEQMMAELGYGGPEVKMQQLKMRLRVICNAIIDQGFTLKT
mgnify:CR=1 FL=1